MQAGYPKPRYPILQRLSKEEIQTRIRNYIVKDPLSFRPDVQKFGTARTGHVPVYDFGKKDKVLLAAATEYDYEVISAYAETLRESGAKVDVYLKDIGRFSSPEDAAAEEAQSLVPGIDNYVYSVMCNVIDSRTAEELIKTEGYTALVGGMGPQPESVSHPWVRLMHVFNEEVSSPAIETPRELRFAIDEKVWNQLCSLEKCRFTDPEGTDFSWTQYDDERLMSIGHEFAKPAHIGHGGKADCAGVVAGTINHLGAFPHVRAQIKDDLVVRVEGGGKYGDAWREKLEQLNKLQLPDPPLRHAKDNTRKFKLPGPGFFWFFEMAIGTSPKVFRQPREARFECFANFLHDRERSGYVHHGFGAPSGTQSSYTKANIPWTHVHIHSMFGTLEGRTKDGTIIKVIDKGHLTALDDLGVRKVASKFGEPDELLSEAWIPPVPGINVEGDYWKDYASNPAEWIRNQQAIASSETLAQPAIAR
jgi:hypothetical protein